MKPIDIVIPIFSNEEGKIKAIKVFDKKCEKILKTEELTAEEAEFFIINATKRRKELEDAETYIFNRWGELQIHFGGKK